MNKIPFAIRKSPIAVIAAQAATLDDYLKLIPIALIVAMAKNLFLTPVQQLSFELTYACSERCLHCFNEGATGTLEIATSLFFLLVVV